MGALLLSPDDQTPQQGYPEYYGFTQRVFDRFLASEGLPREAKCLTVGHLIWEFFGTVVVYGQDPLPSYLARPRCHTLRPRVKTTIPTGRVNHPTLAYCSRNNPAAG